MGYSSRLDEAFLFAHQLHRTQKRKGTDIPYVTHLMAVAALVGEHGGTEDQVIAALLHDAIEDQGGAATGLRIRERFGERVHRIVEACSDTDSFPKPPWRARKEAYLRRLEQCPAEVLLVSVADKVHNARSVVRDLEAVGADVWKRFSGGREGTLWYYQTLAKLYRNVGSHPLVEELNRIVREMERLAAETATPHGAKSDEHVHPANPAFPDRVRGAPVRSSVD